MVKKLIYGLTFSSVISLNSYGAPEVCSLSDVLVCGKSTSVEKIGSLGDKYVAHQYTHIYGESKRASNRIVIVEVSGSLSGIYAVNDFPVVLKNNCLMFSYNASEGNSLCLKNGKLPTEVFLDGEIIEVFK